LNRGKKRRLLADGREGKLFSKPAFLLDLKFLSPPEYNLKRKKKGQTGFELTRITVSVNNTGHMSNKYL